MVRLRSPCSLALSNHGTVHAISGQVDIGATVRVRLAEEEREVVSGVTVRTKKLLRFNATQKENLSEWYYCIPNQKKSIKS
jgi:hypothetical protein